MSGVLPFSSRQERDKGLAPALRPAVRRSAATLVALFTLHVARGDAVQRATEEAVDILATLDSIGGSVAVDAALLGAERVVCLEGAERHRAFANWLIELASTVQAWR